MKLAVFAGDAHGHAQRVTNEYEDSAVVPDEIFVNGQWLQKTAVVPSAKVIARLFYCGKHSRREAHS